MGVSGWPRWNRLSPAHADQAHTTRLCGLDQHKVRRWTSWYRWATLAKLASAFLAVASAAERIGIPSTSVIALSCGEIQHLFTALVVRPVSDWQHRLRWS